MATFLDKEKAVSALKDLIKNAEQTLILISPYLKLSRDFKELLTYRNSKGKTTTVVFGKQELNPDEMAFLYEQRLVILKYNENLHSKCYVNDENMIITSLNLYEFSMANNKEMGVLIDKNDSADNKLFNDAMRDVDYIVETSQPFKINPSKPEYIPNHTETKPTIKTPVSEKTNSTLKGYCIRTGVEIPFNVKKPLSNEGYKLWNKYGDPDYSEKFCHFSGEPSNGETSFNKPILKKNWKKAKEIFSF